MKATRVLYDLGQSLWLDNITRDLLTSGTLKKYIESLSVTGLTSNPTIFDHAVSRNSAYDAEIRRLVGRGLSGETLFFELAIQDLRRRPTCLRPFMNEPMEWTAGFHSRFRRYWPMTRRNPQMKRRRYMRRPIAEIFS